MKFCTKNDVTLITGPIYFKTRLSDPHPGELNVIRSFMDHEKRERKNLAYEKFTDLSQILL